MDRVELYRDLVSQLIERYSSYKLAHGDIRTEAVIDRQRDHYEVYQVGWDGRKRVHGPVMHIDIRDGKVWIEYNGTDRRIAEELIEAGVARKDIILGFQPPEIRYSAGYGVG